MQEKKRKIIIILMIEEVREVKRDISQKMRVWKKNFGEK